MAEPGSGESLLRESRHADVCAVCRNPDGNRGFVAREMMFGLRDEFRYFECAGCGCVQRAEPVDDLGRYYPSTYYSFGQRSEGWLKRASKRARLAHVFRRRSPVGRLLAWRFGVPPDLAAVARAGIQPHHSILDVGCGQGWLLRSLRDAGFERLTGLDPFLPGESMTTDGVALRKLELSMLEGSFDCVMLHHTFEHMEDPIASMRHVRRLLEAEGRAIVRIPVADSYAWRTYGPDWVQLDAPRHGFLHTRRSMDMVASAAGLEVESTVHDSTAFQFWGSEQYRRDVPLIREPGGPPAPKPGLFSSAELRRFAVRAAELNEHRCGDQACFVLRPI